MSRCTVMNRPPMPCMCWPSGTRRKRGTDGGVDAPPALELVVLGVAHALQARRRQRHRRHVAQAESNDAWWNALYNLAGVESGSNATPGGGAR
jgi:hypothetical protein